MSVAQSGRKSRANYRLPVGTFALNSTLSANSTTRRKRSADDHSQPGGQPKRRLAQPPTTPRDSVPSQYDTRLLTDDRVLANLLKLEDDHLRTPGNFDRIQTELKPHMRATVVTWMKEVCMEERCEVETLALAISCLDRFLNVEAIHKCQLQLLATACLFIASKLRQNVQLRAARLVIYTDNSITLDELMSWELLVLGRIKWDVSSVTPYDFLDHLLFRLHSHSQLGGFNDVKEMAVGFIISVISDLSLSTLPPSVIACGSLLSAQLIFAGRDCAESSLNYLTTILGDDKDILRQHVHSITSFLHSAHRYTFGTEHSSIVGSSSAQLYHKGSSNSNSSTLTTTPIDVLDVSHLLYQTE